MSEYGNSRYRLFTCWDPNDQSESHGRRVEQPNARCAAEVFASDLYDSDPTDRASGFTVATRDEDGVQRNFDIHVDMSPRFRAEEVS